MKVHHLKNDMLEPDVGENGGHLWPVQFKGKRGWLEPMHRADWVDGILDNNMPTVLRKLSGDFFAASFGASDVDPSESRPHGATANGSWTLVQIKPGLS